MRTTIISILAILTIIIGLIVCCLWCSNNSNTATTLEFLVGKMVVIRNEKNVTIHYYYNDKLRARFTKYLTKDERWPYKLFLPCREKITGAINNIQIAISRKNKISYFYIEDAVYHCEDARNLKICDKAAKLFNAWRRKLKADIIIQKAIQTNEQTFDFEPYFPTGFKKHC